MGAAHVATTRRRYKDRVYETYLLRQSYREGDSVRHRTLANLSHLPAHIIDWIRRGLRGETLVAPEEAFEIVRSRPHGHVAAILGTMRRLGLDQLLASKPSRQRTLCLAMIAARIFAPASKLATARGLGPETLNSSLGEVLDIAGATADDLYEALDWLASRQGRIEAALARRHLGEGALVCYDVTSVVYEGKTCPLAQWGHPRDGRRGKPQILVGLATNSEGCPVAVEVFPGNTADSKTLAPQVQRLRRRFGLQRVVVVGDRGMITQARIREDLASAQLDWITALRAPQIRQLVEAGALQLSLFDQRDLAEITSPEYPGERLVVCRNPLLATERARKREALLAATEQELDKIVQATRRTARPLRGQTQIALRVGKVIQRFKVGKHFCLQITDQAFSYQRDTAGIAQEALLDGIYVIRSSLPEQALGAEQAVRAYKRLSAVERAFRTLKSLDLLIRPIYHRLEERVRGHVLVCMLAYYVEWHMRGALAPLLFDDDDKAAADALRKSVVAPARRSQKAQRKAETQHTEEGWPVHNFQTLLSDLATIAKNRLELKTPEDVTVEMTTTPTALQQRAFDLLQVSCRM
jgi:transposase